MEATALTTIAGALDTLVFQRGALLGGSGAGAEWAGSVELALEDEPLARAALETGAPQRVSGAAAVRIAGPYYAAEALLVPLPPHGLVVLGGPGAAERDDGAALVAARRAAAAVSEITRDKRIADELAVLCAVKAAGAVEPAGVRAVARHLVQVAATALACEVAALWVQSEAVEPGDEPQDVLALTGIPSAAGRFDSAAQPAATARFGSAGPPAAAHPVSAAHPAAVPGRSPELLEALRALAGAREPVCVQDAAERPLPIPGICSYLALPVATPLRAVLLVAHTEVAPRGFTRRCRTIGDRLAAAAGELLRIGLAREDVQRARFAVR
jgi:hypothetical protein